MDNRLNRILHNKPVKLFYFVRNLARYAVPHRLLQKRLEGVLAEVASRDDRDYILQRVDYYNRLPTASNYPPPFFHGHASARRTSPRPGCPHGLFL